MKERLERISRASTRPWHLASAVLWGLVLGATAAAAEVSVQARVTRSHFTVGDATTLEVTVSGALAGVREPEFQIPDGLEVLGSGRSQSMSANNGTMASATVFRYEIAANRAGSYPLGPMRVQVANQVYDAPALTLTVSAEKQQVQRSGPGPASLVAEVSPQRPYVGQPIILKIRLIQRSTLAEDPRYTPPATPGFWAERASQPESYYADEGGLRVLVTETHTRLYPLAAGEATVSGASAMLALTVPSAGYDPLRWGGGRPPRREVEVRSDPLRVVTKALPEGAPAGFDGAVGQLKVAWSADRGSTSLDVPIAVRLEVRGIGNLPLLHVPDLVSPDFEIFSSAAEDSLGAAGVLGSGMRRFQWTVLAKHQGRLELGAPVFAWFDPEAKAYRVAELRPIAVEVGPSLAVNAATEEGFPSIFVTNPVRPFERQVAPWAFGLVGIALGASVRLWRRASRPPADSAERARQREWLHAIRRGSGSDFWTAADQACVWLEEHGRTVDGLRRQIASTRYGGNKLDPDTVRRILTNELGAALPPPPPEWIPRAGGVALALASIAFGLLVGPRAGNPNGERRLKAADQVARQGDVDRAASAWRALWREGGRQPGVAARLAWAELRGGAMGPAALWALRGERVEPRDAALDWAVQQIRETGGLTGYEPTRFPVRRLEWALIALLAGIGAVLLWPRIGASTAVAAVFLLASTVYPAQTWWGERSLRGVIGTAVTLEGTELELEPGQVVTVLERAEGRARAEVGHGATGWLAEGSLELLEPKP